MRILFIKNMGRAEGQGAGTHYESGKEYTFTGAFGEGYARAYIERGYATEVIQAPPPSAPVAKKPESMPMPAKAAVVASPPKVAAREDVKSPKHEAD